MGLAVELFFDPALEEQLRRVWREVSEKAGVPDTMAAMGSRPHVSLACFESAPLEDTLGAIEAFASKQPVFDIHLDSVGTFAGSEGAVFLAPVPNRRLLNAHAVFIAGIQGLVQGMVSYYLVDRLVFHCTIAYGLQDQQIPAVVAAARQTGLPLVGRVELIGLVKPSDGTILGDFKLAGA
jgi:2'-5' RNA ligase